jgi:hypothetical protein
MYKKNNQQNATKIKLFLTEVIKKIALKMAGISFVSSEIYV